MSRLFKWLIFLLGLSVLLLSIVSLIAHSHPSLSFNLKLLSQALLVIEFLLISLFLFRKKRQRKNAVVILVCALVFAFSAVQTFLAHS